MLLAEHFKQKAKDPLSLREKLIELHERTANGDTNIRPPSSFTLGKFTLSISHFGL